MSLTDDLLELISINTPHPPGTRLILDKGTFRELLLENLSFRKFDSAASGCYTEFMGLRTVAVNTDDTLILIG